MRVLILFLLLTVHAVAGYDVHITRRKDWSDEKGPVITLAEWKTLVSSDPDMRLDGFAEITIDADQKLRMESEGLAVWIKYSRHGEKGNMAWFLWSRGNITVKNPDEEIRGKMFRLAKKLKAKVQGDEGELYGEKGEEVR